ncbi:MAG: hypothetical protein JSU67_05965 [Gammaproteobacteria bacterium]|nr:MAG: hypothetical protein JSU67_05965 [Gammaproteobacteria bacterium]
MLATEQDESTYRVYYRSYFLSLLLLLIPPALLYEHGPSLLDGSIDASDLAGLIIGIVLPLLGAYYLTEFACFSFSLEQDVFRWRWHNFIRRREGQVPLQRVVKVRRESLESSGSAGLGYAYRLVVILDDDSVIPLTRGFSGLHGRKLDQIVDQIRAHLGHFVPVR